MPEVRPYYAVKCNSEPRLLSWLHSCGAGFDCASSREMIQVSDLYKKIPIDKNILFANPCKTIQDINVAKRLSIPWVTIDSVEELEKMSKAEYRPEVILRLMVDDKGSTSPFAAKFGAPVEKVHEITRAAKDYKMPIVGLSFHVGSGSSRPEAFSDAVNLSKSVWNIMGLNQFKILDLGGGWSPDEEIFKQQTLATRKALYTNLGPTRPYRIIAEPGRFFAAPIYSLYVKVIGKKPKSSGGWRYTLDESIYGQFSCIPFDHATPKIAALGDSDKNSTSAILFGRTCDSLDWIANSFMMRELDVDDWLYIPNMGAYTSATSTEFNGFPKPDIIETEVEPSKVKWLNLTYPLSTMLSIDDATRI